MAHKWDASVPNLGQSPDGAPFSPTLTGMPWAAPWTSPQAVPSNGLTCPIRGTHAALAGASRRTAVCARRLWPRNVGLWPRQPVCGPRARPLVGDERRSSTRLRRAELFFRDICLLSTAKARASYGPSPHARGAEWRSGACRWSREACMCGTKASDSRSPPASGGRRQSFPPFLLPLSAGQPCVFGRNESN